MENLKELFKNVVEKFFFVGVSAGLSAIIPLLESYQGKWKLGIAIVAAVLLTINKWLKDDKKVYAKLTEKIRS